MIKPEHFQRARRPEQKAHRRASILKVAAGLARRKGLRSVSLGDIALAVGLTKSNVLRYFETREDIYLQLASSGYRSWADRVIDRLGELAAAGPVGPTEVATALTECLAVDMLFCNLVSEGASALERNVSPEAVRVFKQSFLVAVEDLAEALVSSSDCLVKAQADETIMATIMLAAGLWPWCNPPSALVDLYRTEPEVIGTRLEFVPQLKRLVEAVVRGLPTSS